MVFWLFFCVLRPTNKAAVQQKSAKMEVGIADDQVLYIIGLQYSKLKVAKLESSPALKPKTFLFYTLASILKWWSVCVYCVQNIIRIQISIYEYYAMSYDLKTIA